jgi:hypothetical protein
MKLIHCAVVAPFLFLTAAGCRGASKDPDIDATPAPTDNKIQDVQNDTVPDATPIKLDGVIVSAIDGFGNRKGTFYVQEPEGGPFSGVLVFGAKAADVALLTVGDLINIGGAEKDEFLPPGDTSKRTVTELKAVTGGALVITKVGKGALPAPADVDVLAIAAMPAAARDAELEKWEGVPITVRNVAQLEDVRPITSNPPDPTFMKFTINAGIEVDTSLAAFPTAGLGRDVCLAGITGMGDYFYAYKVLPRSSADITAGGTGCPAPEVGAAACNNATDDDLDGFADCLDRSCQQDFASTCQAAATIEQVQTDTYPKPVGKPLGLVFLDDVYVTAITTSIDPARANLKSVWVSHAYGAALNQGVQVFVGRGTIPAGVVIGAKVDVVGTVVEFDNTNSTGDKLTEINNPAIRVEAAPDGTAFVPLTGITLPTVGNIGAPGEPYEGVLLRFTGLKVTALGGGDTVTLSDTATPPNTITVDDDIFDYAAADFTVNTCYATLDAIASLNTVADTRMLLPRAVTDVVKDDTGAACAPAPPPLSRR